MFNYKLGTEKVLFEVGCKCFDDKIEKAFELMKEIMFTSKLNDTKKIKEIIGRSKAQMQGRLLSSGHQTAALKGAACINKASYLNDLLTGVGYYEFIEDLSKVSAPYEDNDITIEDNSMSINSDYYEIYFTVNIVEHELK